MGRKESEAGKARVEAWKAYVEAGKAFDNTRNSVLRKRMG